MNFKKNLFSAIIVLALVSPTFATAPTFDEGTKSSKALTEIKTLVKKEMENAIKLDIPVKVDMGVGKIWLEAH